MADAIPEASLMNFLAGLRAQGLMQLGEIPPPGGQRQVNLPFARYTLGLIKVLRDKTAGNRDAPEEALIQGIITELEGLLARRTAPSA